MHALNYSLAFCTVNVSHFINSKSYYLRVDLVKLQIVVLEFSVDVKSAVMFMFLSFVSAIARNVWFQMAK